MSTNRNPVLVLMREFADPGDPWGTAMSWSFGVAEVLHARGEDVPDELGYRPSPFVALSSEQPEEWPDLEVWSLLAQGDATVADLKTAGRCLSRYLDLCRSAGLDY